MSEEVYFVKSKGKLLLYSDNLIKTDKTDKTNKINKKSKKGVKNE